MCLARNTSTEALLSLSLSPSSSHPSSAGTLLIKSGCRVCSNCLPSYYPNAMVIAAITVSLYSSTTATTTTLSSSAAASASASASPLPLPLRLRRQPPSSDRPCDTVHSGPKLHDVRAIVGATALGSFLLAGRSKAG